MENIQEDYVSFDAAKLLKEKGFYDGWCMTFYENGIFVDESVHTRKKYCKIDDFAHKYPIILAPTQALAVKWLRVKHNIHITSNRMSHSDRPYDYYIGKNGAFAITSKDTYLQPEQAIDAAILYTLKNLLK